MNKWIKEIPTWYFVHPTVEDVCNGRAKSQNDTIRKEVSISCWSNEIEYLTSRIKQETDENGKIKNIALYNIGIKGFKHSHIIDSATYAKLQEQLMSC